MEEGLVAIVGDLKSFSGLLVAVDTVGGSAKWADKPKVMRWGWDAQGVRVVMGWGMLGLRP